MGQETEYAIGFSCKKRRPRHDLVYAEQVQRAIMAPPEGTPAFTRGLFIRSRRPSWSPIRISWDSALVGGRLFGRLIRFPGAVSRIKITDSDVR